MTLFLIFLVLSSGVSLGVTLSCTVGDLGEIAGRLFYDLIVVVAATCFLVWRAA